MNKQRQARRKWPQRLENNVVREDVSATQLRCGHNTKAHPLVSSPLSARRWWCETCRSLVASK